VVQHAAMTTPHEPVLPDDPGAAAAPSAPASAPAPVPPDEAIDLGESVAGEEDPGASLDLAVGGPAPPKPERE
jgi:hypothetical protein